MVSIEIKFDENQAQEIISTLEKMNVIIEDNILQKLKEDPYYFQRKKELQKLVEDIESRKEKLYDFNEEIDKLILKYSDENS